MGIDTIALLRVPREALPTGMLLKLIDDGALVYTLVRHDSDPDALAFGLRRALGSTLDAHVDRRGIFVFPDVAELRARTYEDIVAEVGVAGAWVPRVSPTHVPDVYRQAPTGSANAIVGTMLGAIGPELGARIQAATSSGDRAALSALEEDIMRALGGSEQAAALDRELRGALEREAPAYAAEMEARASGRRQATDAARSRGGAGAPRAITIGAMTSSQRVIADLEELAKLTSDERGAHRVAWGPVWRKTREWFTGKLAELGLTPRLDGAANMWATLPGASSRSIVLGSHLDSVPGGGWLDGCLGVLAGLEVLRREKAKGTPALTMHLVDWADEEGARFGRSLTGSAATAGALDPHGELAHLVDRAGVKLPDALAENGVTLDGMATAHAFWKTLDAVAYLELHIEQGPVLEEMKAPVGVVLGTMGVERYNLRFQGQAAHSGAAPIHLRKDAFLAAAEFALACRAISIKYSGKTPKSRVVATCGVVKVEPNFVTAVPGSTEISIDLRALDGKVLKKMLSDAQAASKAAAKKHLAKVTWSPLLHITPRPFDPTLMGFVRESIKEVCAGKAPELPSGPLHDAAEMAAIVPTAMVFAMSSPGVSHTRIEDTPRPAIDKSCRAFFATVERALAHYAAERGAPAKRAAKRASSPAKSRSRGAAVRAR